MKRFIFIVLLFFLIAPLGACSCSSEQNNLPQQLQIPAKNNNTDTSSRNSPVNSTNLDQYMFRDDVQYVDLRSIEMITSEGYIAGFQFIPFYSIIASFTETGTLYRMKSIRDENDNYFPAGQPGSFAAQYEEADNIIKSLFSKDKYIFLVSQGGSECSYVINLLIQLGYDASLLYNVGGVMNSEGLPSYSSIKTNKYFVEGHGNLDISIEYNFMNDLTPIVNN